PNTSPTPSAAETAILVRIISLSVCGRRARVGEVSEGARARSACLIRHCEERPLRVVLADAETMHGVNPTDDRGSVTNHDTVTEYRALPLVWSPVAPIDAELRPQAGRRAVAQRRIPRRYGRAGRRGVRIGSGWSGLRIGSGRPGPGVGPGRSVSSVGPSHPGLRVCAH